ncbi:MAG: hypothetical protein ACXAC5_01650 [Promethearchaeota archaeon]|jgi:hypothetical protein
MPKPRNVDKLAIALGPRSCLNEKQFTEFLTALRDKCKCRITGSYARCCARLNSDLDLIVHSDSGMKRAIKIFDLFGVRWDSIIIGQIASPRNMWTLPIPVEVMCKEWLTPIPKNERPETITIHGVTFKTW